MRRYGWRAYALPVLTMITVAVAVQGAPDSPSTRTAAAPTPTVARPTESTAPVNRALGTGAVQVEGLSAGDAGYAAGTAPEPIVLRLGDDAVSCATNSYQQLVLVSISKQHLWACEGSTQLRSVAVTTGKSVDNDQTPLGSWRVQAKERDRYLVGAGYRDYVHYWIPFNGDFGLHDAPWQTMPFGSQDYRENGSHGCVHLPTNTMAWIYQWARVGHTVVTIES